MSKRRRESREPSSGGRATAGNRTLRSWTVGALPLVNRLLERLDLEALLEKHLPPDDPRVQVPTARGLLLLIRNVLFSREPVYGVAEWAERHPPELLGLAERQLGQLNDDRLGRCLDRLFDAPAELVLDVVRQAIAAFDLQLDELHNDSTTVSFYGDYAAAAKEGERRGRATAAIKHGHSKDRRPDLKQLLYTLTITDDGGVPIYYTSASGNTSDTTTHQDTWQLLCSLVGRADFLYVADCKLATTKNLQFIHNRGGRFISILPRSRREDHEFRRRLRTRPDSVPWKVLYHLTDEEGRVVDQLRSCDEEADSAEGFRLVWIHSSRKQERDAAARVRAIERTMEQLARLRQRMESPRTRYRTREKVQEAIEKIFQARRGGRWLRVKIVPTERVRYKQAGPGRPNENTQYIKQVSKQFTLKVEVNHEKVADDQSSDGVYPLISNEREFSHEELLRAYKRQPLIEKRFSQFKTDYQVAPVYLKEVSRIQALLGVYFYALLLQTLLERELRRALQAAGEESLPLYPESRDCKAPTTRRVLDIFDSVQRHELTHADRSPVYFITELTPLQQRIAELLQVAPESYGTS
jgi:transposase